MGKTQKQLFALILLALNAANICFSSPQLPLAILRRLNLGAIRRHCVCPASFTPVCASNGRVYASACEAVCAGVVSDKSRSSGEKIVSFLYFCAAGFLSEPRVSLSR